MAKPDWQLKRRDSERGYSRARDYREPLRDDVVWHLASNRRPDGPRQDNSKPQLPKQGVNGALRAANLRLLLEKAPLPEALALVAEVPLERLEAMSRGALCPDETAFHIERALKLPGKWLDGLNNEVPERTLELLKHPDKAAAHDDDFDEEALTTLSVAAAAPAQSAAVLPAVTEAASGLAQGPDHDASAQHGQEAQVVTSAFVEFVQEEAFLAAGGDNAMAAVEDLKVAARPAIPASMATMATFAVQPRSSAAAARSNSGPKATCPMPSPELRTQNLSILLQGKGAKSALARLIGISQPYMSTIANGGKVLDEEFCRNVAQTLGMPDDWFETPRTAADIPTAALQRLAPLPRGKGASANAAPPSDTAAVQTDAAGTGGETTPETAVASAESNEPATAVTNAAEDHTATTSATRQDTALREQLSRPQPVLQRAGQQRSEANGQDTQSLRSSAAAPVQADLLSHIELEVQPAARGTTPAENAEVFAVPAMVLDSAPVMAAVSASAHQAVQQTNDLTPVSVQPLIIDGGLAPITEALIKILVLKARQGALSEDKAFELLAAVRLL